MFIFKYMYQKIIIVLFNLLILCNIGYSQNHLQNREADIDENMVIHLPSSHSLAEQYILSIQNWDTTFFPIASKYFGAISDNLILYSFEKESKLVYIQLQVNNNFQANTLTYWQQYLNEQAARYKRYLQEFLNEENKN